MYELSLYKLIIHLFFIRFLYVHRQVLFHARYVFHIISPSSLFSLANSMLLFFYSSTRVHRDPFHARFISRHINLILRSFFSRYSFTRYLFPRYLFLTSPRDIFLGKNIIAIFFMYY